ncbi:MAG: hypothetical protein A3I76_01100 [Elusimicrobia bacterium RIFCSPLOWO2_02_FULL_61_11]|nr:MAG: hypothetical protein A3I76_01100 [Elusimicrobia bacterium RIFCSPLOWO2_02_FULL_61_11]
MNKNEPSSGMTFENLKNIEAELFAKRRKARPPAEVRRPEEPKSSRDTWRLNQEVLDAKKENAALKQELDAVRLVLTEQNVLTASALSALKELKEDITLLKARLCDREADLADLAPEISRLHSEINMEKRRNEELLEKLEREETLQENLEKARERLAREARVKEETGQTSAADLQTGFFSITRRLREERTRRFSNKYY